jgi:hemin uptake protein HemP
MSTGMSTAPSVPHADTALGAPHRPPAAVQPGPQPLSTDALFPPGCREIEIDHLGVFYRLRVTAQGKLLLTK